VFSATAWAERDFEPSARSRAIRRIGAETKIQPMKPYQFSFGRQVSAALVLFLIFFGACGLTSAQPSVPGNSQASAVSLPPGVADVVKLTQAGLNEDVILAQIKSSGSSYQLTSDQIVYLANVGVSQNVIKALISGNTSAAANGGPAPAASQDNSGYAAPGSASVYAINPAPAAAAPVVQSLYVPASVPWIDTRIDLAPGEAVAITATGAASYKPGFRVSPQGDPYAPTNYAGGSCLAPNLPAWSLIGKIGQYGQPFEIGSGASLAAPIGGRLYLSMNDSYFPDNSGAWNVTLTLGQGGAAPMVQAGPPARVSFDYFHDQLAPYGNWVQTSYGWCWSPGVAVSDGGWRPYSDQGQWVYTDNGWFWQSEYSWGDIAFHYGRWYRDMSYGWLWVPDYTWAPAWVCWRNAEADGYFGWAALPPGARFVSGEGLYFDGRLAMDIDFGLGWDAFVFVGFDHFWDHDYRHFLLFGDRAAFMYRRSVILNGYRMVGGRFVIDGLGRDRIARFTHRDVRVEDVRNLRARDERAHIEARRVDDVRAGRQPARAADARVAEGRPNPGTADRRDAPEYNRQAPANQHPAATQEKSAPAKAAPSKPQPQQEKKQPNQ
jgi:hypothetical protein